MTTINEPLLIKKLLSEIFKNKYIKYNTISQLEHNKNFLQLINLKLKKQSIKQALSPQIISLIFEFTNKLVDNYVFKHPFLDKLKKLGFKTEYFDANNGCLVPLCDDTYDENDYNKEHIYYFFHQEYVQSHHYDENKVCKSKYLTWYYSRMDYSQFDESGGMLVCGGLYTNFYVFENEECIEGDIQKILDPEEIIDHHDDSDNDSDNDRDENE